ncbi:ABC transporter substrate-binding protein [Streptomyces spinoverrucosus]|uniref:ABC transporter substrate-binding protein n=1 Tax=Streptomyces spinoverrucosus TaxID=284043 RepID=UPI0018C398C3|nr:ABC transporter substrate-binding protein [Streptomyces spinoverrucosus]MBG0854455.1 ABC transporter substrate-binding protein [Streptomyces spinoverrucosus]
MTGRRRTRSTFLPTLTRPVRALPKARKARKTRKARTVRTARTAGVLVACASLAAGCGVIPGFTGGAGDDPITVMTWAPQDTNATNKPGMPALAMAYARHVNADGGINGRKLKVINCNDRNDSVNAAKCARRAVKEKVVAVVGSYSQFADTFFPILEGAGIPYIGGYGITNAEFTSPLSYPVNGGQPALLAGLGRQLASSCGPVALVRPDTIAGDELPNLLNSGLEAGGHQNVTDVRAAEDATEYSSQSEQALDRATTDPTDPGCVVPALGDRTNTFMDSFRRAREDYPDVRMGTVLGSVDQTVIDATGGASSPYEGAYITGWYPVEADKRWDGMKKVIREQAFTDTRIDPADAGVQTTWIAYTVLEAALKALGDGEVSSDTVRRTLDDGFKVTTGGLTPTLRWQFQDVLASVGFPRLVNTDVTLQQVKDGQLVAARQGAIDVTKTLQGAEEQG